jgi:hypothetical protein
LLTDRFLERHTEARRSIHGSGGPIRSAAQISPDLQLSLETKLQISNPGYCKLFQHSRKSPPAGASGRVEGLEQPEGTGKKKNGRAGVLLQRW